MSSRGIMQLQKLTIYSCKHGGSSYKINAMLDKVQQNANVGPLLKTESRNGHHPYVRAEYINGYTKQICLRGVETEQELVDKLLFLRNSFGQQSLRHAGKKVYSIKKSIQGTWNENTFPNYPRHEMEISRSFPRVEITEGIEAVKVHIPKEEDRKVMDPYRALLRKRRLD